MVGHVCKLNLGKVGAETKRRGARGSNTEIKSRPRSGFMGDWVRGRDERRPIISKGVQRQHVFANVGSVVYRGGEGDEAMGRE